MKPPVCCRFFRIEPKAFKKILKCLKDPRNNVFVRPKYLESALKIYKSFSSNSELSKAFFKIEISVRKLKRVTEASRITVKIVTFKLNKI